MTRHALRRGTVVTVASPGVYSGKPRPAVVVQADRWLQAHPSITLCPLTSTLMVDKLFTVPIQTIGEVVGQLEPQALVDLDLALRDWLQLA
jgi:mRNA interferase MazF